MKSLLKYCLLLFLWSTVVSLSAQKTKVSGRITDVITKEGVPFSNVYFQGTKIGTTTNFEGYYVIETYYASDSLTVSSIGYKRISKKIKKDREQIVNFAISESSIAIEEVVIKADKKAENPAHPIVRNILSNKKINNRDKLEAYEYETYNKVEFDLNNLTDEFTSRKVLKPFEFIWDNLDSTDEKLYLPIFMTESVSNFYFRKSPKVEKEIIKATKVSGIENNSVSQFLGDMYQSVNIYDNNIVVFGKSFVSPISKLGFTFYHYYLEDSTYIDNKWCYNIIFQPKRKQELTFTGDFWVNDTTYAIKNVSATISEDANINYIYGLKVEQDFNEIEPEVWMMTQDKLTIDFNVTKKTMGFYGRKTTTYKDFVINTPRKDEFYKGTSDIEVHEDANEKDETYWDSARHVSLTDNEKNIYSMVDSIQSIPQFRTIVDVIELFVTGYKVLGKFEFGPYSSVYSFNPVEGPRVRLGGRTSNDFSTNVMLEGYAAYGFRDEQYKYGGGITKIFNKNPRFSMYLGGKKDIEQLGQAEGAFQSDNFLSSMFRRNPPNKLTAVTEVSGYVEKEWFYGFSNKIILTHRVLKPLGLLEYKRPNIENIPTDIPHIITSEVSLYTRFAYKEKFVTGEFNRISLGTKYPTLELIYSRGISGLLESQYEYDKMIVRIKDKILLGPFGKLRVRFEAGKIWGALPYPLLQLHQGNETFFYDETAFNTMNYFEFVSDEWASGAVTYHADGLFFNKIPLLRKLKWREVVAFKGVVGSYNPENNQELLLPVNTQTITKPFVEGSFGIENIFKFVRIDALYRLSYLDNPDIVKFGIRAKLQFDF